MFVAKIATMDRLQAMEIFIRVTEAGSFAAAADRLGLARSVVTRQIAALEAHLGVKLLARSTRRLSLTSAGTAYLEKCREILDLVGAAEGDLAGSHRIPHGLIRLSLPLSFGIHHIIPLLSDFLAAYPDVNLDIDFNDRVVNLIESGVDLAIRIAERLEPTQVARSLSVSRMVTVASPAYLDRHGTPSHPDQLASHQCLAYTGTQRSGWPYRIDGELRWIAVPSRLQANNGDALLDACIRGLGIIYNPTFLAATAIKAGLLKVILEDFPAPEMGIYAVLPGNRYIPHRVRVLIDYLAERIGPEPYWDH